MSLSKKRTEADDLLYLKEKEARMKAIEKELQKIEKTEERPSARGI